jgi:8-oxo-dGTP pyrophosphatase MutT (NUDIX family)
MIPEVMEEKLRLGLSQSPPVTLEHFQQAAVLVLLNNLGNEPRVVLTQRAVHMRLHAGEVAFPGGKCDADDLHPWGTALREAEEEIRLPADCVRRLGMMRPLTTRSDIQVTPCVAVLARPTHFEANPEELDAVFEVPLAFLARRDSLQMDQVRYRGSQRSVPRYDFGEYTIWGITAAILVQLVNLACDAGLQLDHYWKENEK